MFRKYFIRTAFALALLGAMAHTAQAQTPVNFPAPTATIIGYMPLETESPSGHIVTAEPTQATVAQPACAQAFGACWVDAGLVGYIGQE